MQRTTGLLPIITLTTDFGTTDNYVGALKGVILSINPRVNIMDITHDIKPYDIESCSYILSSFYRYYPSHTINIAIVDPGVGSTRKPLLIKADDYYFIGPDNGIFSSVLDISKSLEIYELNNSQYFLDSVSSTFHGRDIFAPVSAYLSLGTPLADLGEHTVDVKRLPNSLPVQENGKIIGNIIYEDRFGNLITNIKEDLIRNIEKIIIGGYEIDKISNSYSDVGKGDLLAIIGSSGRLEISANMDSAARTVDRKASVVCYVK